MQDKIKELVDGAQRIVVVQADNPDADSLGSALSLEHILGDLGKDVAMYCGVDVPTYLRYLTGWGRIVNELPSSFDLSIVVDASTYTLLEKLEQSGQLGWLKPKPCIVLDHHATVERPIDFATVSLVEPKAASTGQLIYELAHSLGWKVNKTAAGHIMSSILGDTQGLMNYQTTAQTYRVMADLTDLGADRPLLEELRREYSRMAQDVFRYKGELIRRLDFAADGRIAHVSIPQAEINEYSPHYNPAVLIQFDSLQVNSVQLSIVFKTYDDGRITGKLRSNLIAPVAGKLAEHMGGGGHPYSAGFKVTDGRPFNEVKSECLAFATELLDNLDKDAPDEALQHPDA
ncbi:MAG TPA: DHH family phosphoesterase [Candidatus Saccharimonadales bacterium]|nr:DHH family phosphoesterase [Candidatus Saccharimonadales bacterium]